MNQILNVRAPTVCEIGPKIRDAYYFVRQFSLNFHFGPIDSPFILTLWLSTRYVGSRCVFGFSLSVC